MSKTVFQIPINTIAKISHLNRKPKTENPTFSYSLLISITLFFIASVAIVNILNGHSSISSVDKISVNSKQHKLSIYEAFLNKVKAFNHTAENSQQHLNKAPDTPHSSYKSEPYNALSSSSLSVDSFNGSSSDGQYIRTLPGGKDKLRTDYRVILPEFEYQVFKRPPGKPSGTYGKPRGYIDALARLQALSYFTYINDTVPLATTLQYIKSQPQCHNKPVFLTMATVGDELYWQLIENFIYTMIRFDLIECALVVCVSDDKCMKLCSENSFPCYNFHSTQTVNTHIVMEQIAELKLYHLPKVCIYVLHVYVTHIQYIRICYTYVHTIHTYNSIILQYYTLYTYTL